MKGIEDTQNGEWVLKSDVINILNKRIKYHKTNMKLIKEAILRAQSFKDFKIAIANMKNYENMNYALFVLNKLKEEYGSQAKGEKNGK